MTTNQQPFQITADRTKARQLTSSGMRFGDPTSVTITDRYGHNLAATTLDPNQKWTPPASIAELADGHYPLTITTTTR